eukprot:UN23169
MGENLSNVLLEQKDNLMHLFTPTTEEQPQQGDSSELKKTDVENSENNNVTNKVVPSIDPLPGIIENNKKNNGDSVLTTPVFVEKTTDIINSTKTDEKIESSDDIQHIESESIQRNEQSLSNSAILVEKPYVNNK